MQFILTHIRTERYGTAYISMQLSESSLGGGDNEILTCGLRNFYKLWFSL